MAGLNLPCPQAFPPPLYFIYAKFTLEFQRSKHKFHVIKIPLLFVYMLYAQLLYTHESLLMRLAKFSSGGLHQVIKQQIHVYKMRPIFL